MNRREMLSAAGSLCVVTIAGCSGDTGGTDDEPPDGTTGDGDPGGSNGGPNEDVNRADSFVMEVHGGSSGAGTEVTVRVNGQNSRMAFDGEQDVEVFLVDGDIYQVVDGRCFTNPGESRMPDVGPAPEPGEQWDPIADLPGGHDGRDTIDGREMLVYDYEPGEDTVYEGAQVTAYVDADTGYLRRVESAEWRVDYHSWGEVEPIEAPDMECQDFDGGFGAR
jgi:hypothetical protein